MCFVDLTKAFDCAKLEDVINILQEKNVPTSLIRLIKNLNMEQKTRIKVNGDLTEEIDMEQGIRQGDSLSPMLFNLLMDKIIDSIRTKPGYRIGRQNINIVCYADDAVLVADSEDNLQRLLHQFTITAESYNMRVSTDKTKSLVISKDPRRCKLEINQKLIEQVMEFSYLGVKISSHRNLNNEVKQQAAKGARMSGYLRDIVWKTSLCQQKLK